MLSCKAQLNLLQSSCFPLLVSPVFQVQMKKVVLFLSHPFTCKIFLLSCFLVVFILIMLFCLSDLDLSLNPSGEVTKQIGDTLPVSCTISASRNATVVWMKVSPGLLLLSLFLSMRSLSILVYFVLQPNMYIQSWLV